MWLISFLYCVILGHQKFCSRLNLRWLQERAQTRPKICGFANNHIIKHKKNIFFFSRVDTPVMWRFNLRLLATFDGLVCLHHNLPHLFIQPFFPYNNCKHSDGRVQFKWPKSIQKISFTFDIETHYMMQGSLMPLLAATIFENLSQLALIPIKCCALPKFFTV